MTRNDCQTFEIHITQTLTQNAKQMFYLDVDSKATIV